MVLPLYAVLERQEASLLEAAADLGCTPRQAFWRVTFPLSLPGVLAGALLCFIPMVGEFVIPDLLGGSDTLMIGQTLWTEFFANHDWPVASALAIVVFACLLAVFVWLGYLLEAAYFRQFAWTHALLGDHLFTDASQALLVIAEYAARHALFALVGLIVGYGYYRVGGVWGTFLLPFTLVVPLAAGVAILGLPGMTALLTFGGIVGATPTGVGLSVPYFALLVLVGRYLLSTVPIRTKTG